MAKGAESKKIVADKILKTFDGSFLYNNGKEIRIPIEENGEILQIKVALTCSKTNVQPGEDTVMPGDVQTPPVAVVPNSSSTSFKTVEELKPTEEEKRNVSILLQSLGL